METISVTASVTDSGILSYQWYSNTTDSNSGGTLKSGATLASYTVPTTNTGTTYYYCIITNTNSSATGSATTATASDTATVSVIESSINVTDIEFANIYQLMELTTNDSLTGVCPYTITPSDATDTSVTWSSSNPNVASISSNNITSYAVGRTTIEVIANDAVNGTISDTMVVEVKDSDASTADTKYIYLNGMIVDSNGNPLVDYIVTLYSDPVTTTTNSSGEFSFTDTPLMNHTLVVNRRTAVGLEEVGRYALNIDLGDSSSVVPNNQTKAAAITYTRNTFSIDLEFSVNIAFNDIDIVSGNVINRIISDNNSNAQIPNPKTSDDSQSPQDWWCLIGILHISVIVIYIKKSAWYAKRWNK